MQLLTDELGKVAAAIPASRRVADMPRGRYPIRWTDDAISTPIPHVQGNRSVVSLLLFDAMRLAEEGQYEAALKSWRAALNTSHALGDEPILISMVVRLVGESTTIWTLERILAQGEPNEDTLSDLQQMLEKVASSSSPLCFSHS